MYAPIDWVLHIFFLKVKSTSSSILQQESVILASILVVSFSISFSFYYYFLHLSYTLKISNKIGCSIVFLLVDYQHDESIGLNFNIILFLYNQRAI